MSLRRLFTRARQDRDRAEEMQAHLDHAIQHYIDQGCSPDEARRRARLRFGNPRAHREGVDDLNRLPIADTMTRDLRYAARMLRRSPAFSATVVLTLTLVIGATSAVFTLADAVLIRALPFPQPDRLAIVAMQETSTAGQFVRDATDGAMWESVRDRIKTIDAAVGFSGASGVNFVSGSTASFVRAQRVSAGYFRVLGIQPIAGREFTAEEDRPGGPAVAILSYDFWQRIFQGRREAVGQTILLRGQPYQVVGVMPKDFRGTTDADVWTPIRPSTRGEGGGTNYTMIARLSPGQTWEQATAELLALGDEPFRLFKPREGVTRQLVPMPMQEMLVRSARQPIVILTAAVVVVLLIACVNIAALLIARGGSRAKEIATRMALGSGRVAVVRQLMVESAVLAILGGIFGVFVSVLSLQALQRLAGSTFGEWPPVGLDLRTLVVTGGLSLLTSVVFGLVPALQASRVNLQAALVESGARGIAGGTHRLRRVLVVAEVALGVVLLVSAGLLVRQFINLRSLEPGFNPDHLFTASVAIQDARYATPADINRLFDGTIERLRQTPGITAASVSQGLPYQRLLNMGFRIEGQPTDDVAPITNLSYVTTGFFSTFGIPITAGRAMDDHDTAAAPPVVVVNQLFTRLYLQQRNPIGLRLMLGGRPVEIVGVAGDVMQFGSGFYVTGMGNPNSPIRSSPTIYVPAAQANMGMFGWFSPVWTLRAASAGAATAAIREAMFAVDPLMPVSEVRSMAEVVSRAISRQRLMMWLVGVMAAAAALLAAIGLHGLIAQSVAERTRELGIRLALGARPGATLGSVALSGAALSGLGALIGGALSFPATSLIASLLVDVPRLDGVTYLAVTLLVLLVTAIASVLPAMRILRLDPAKTLRE